MASEVAKVANLKKTFLWKDRTGRYWTPQEMETRHLFMTLVMIWNHKMPYEFFIERSGSWQHHLHYMGPFYTDEYMAQGVAALLRELATRKNIHPDWQATLDVMQKILKTHQLQEDHYGGHGRALEGR